MLVTLIGDVIALAIVTLIALLLLPVGSHLPIVGRSLSEYAEVRPPLAVESLMIPWTIFVLYGYGLYRSSARSINGWVVSEGLRGLTALSVAAWSMLVLTLAVAGTTDSLGMEPAVTTVGRPDMAASSTTWPKVSAEPGKTKMSDEA